jgi:hypothetical protein
MYIFVVKKPWTTWFSFSDKNPKQSGSAPLHVAACLVVTVRISTEFLVNQNKPVTVSSNE